MGNSIPIRPTSTNKIALFGAAGAIGHSIATAISAQGAPFRVVGRSRDALATAFGADSLAEIVTWNPDDPVSVRTVHAPSLQPTNFALSTLVSMRLTCDL